MVIALPRKGLAAISANPASGSRIPASPALQRHPRDPAGNLIRVQKLR